MPLDRWTAARRPVHALRTSRYSFCRHGRGASYYALFASCTGAAASGGADALPAAWRGLAPFELRHGQVETLGAVATGHDVLSRQPTGSGKSI